MLQSDAAPSTVTGGTQDQSLEDFTNTLDCALHLGMPKLLACCEYHISADSSLDVQPVSLHLEHVVPISRMSRIAEGLQMAFHRMAAGLRKSHTCPCPTCSHGYGSIKSECTSKECARAMFKKYGPGPAEYFQMAQRQG